MQYMLLRLASLKYYIGFALVIIQSFLDLGIDQLNFRINKLKLCRGVLLCNTTISAALCVLMVCK
jgi:hypothetical protein